MATAVRPSKKRRVQLRDPLTHAKSTERVLPTPPSPPRKKPAKSVERAISPTLRKPADRESKGKQPAAPAPAACATFKIIAGSYEKLLYGLEAAFAPAPAGASPPWRIVLTPRFVFPAHVSCIKAVAASPTGGKWLATGSADEMVKVWDLRRRKELGSLIHHEGSITYLTFPSRSHLLSASEDGTLCLFRARDWAVLRTLKGHKGRVNAVAVHPSRKLALSVGRDRTLRMWDLMRGIGAGSTKLGKEGEVVCWSPSGERFAVQALATIDLYSTKMMPLCTISHPSRIHDVAFFRPHDDTREYLLVAAEDKKVTVYELPSAVESAPTAIAELVGATNRVKAIAMHDVALPPYAAHPTATIASTISSDGCIRLYDLAAAVRATAAVAPVAEYDTGGSRLTCLAMADGDGSVDGGEEVGGKRKRGGEEDGDQEDEDEEEEWESADGVEGEGAEDTGPEESDSDSG